MSEKLYRRLTLKRLIQAGVLLLLTAALWFWQYTPSFHRMYPPFSRAVSRFLAVLFSPVPFPVAEIILYALILGVFTGVAYFIYRLIVKPGRPDFLARSAANAMASVCMVLFLFYLLWGMNYHAGSRADAMGLEQGRYTVDELHETARWLLENANALAGQVSRNTEGAMDEGGFRELRQASGAGYAELARMWPGLFDANPPPPKRVIAGHTLRRFGIVGVYSPFTGEANVTGAVLDSELPFIMAHELAHRMGVMNEAEANFIAFLACIHAPNPKSAYPGWLSALGLCLNALARENRELSDGIWRDMHPGLIADYTAQYNYAKQFEGPAQDFGTAVNDTYLRAMAIPEGVKSYGLAVDLIMAYYFSG